MDEIAIKLSSGNEPLSYQIVSYKVFWRSELTNLFAEPAEWIAMRSDDLRPDTPPSNDDDGNEPVDDNGLKRAAGALDEFTKRDLE